MKKYIYADNAATTQLDSKALNEMLVFLKEEYGNASQPYSFSRNVKKTLNKARSTIAECINASPDEIFFTSGGTESDNWALKGFLWNKPKSSEILTTEFEHHAILNTCLSLKELGYKTNFVKPTNKGYIDLKSFENCITKNTIIASVMMVNNELGTIQPIKELAHVAHQKGVLFHTDAVQALGHINIDVKDLDIDFLSGSAHKFNGPKGIGFLYIKGGVDLHPLLDGGSQEKSIRAGTENISSILGMSIALKDNCLLIKENQLLLKNYEKYLLDGLVDRKIPFVLNGGDIRMPGILSLSFANQDGESILHRLDLMGIGISTGAACDSINKKISHVLKSIGLDENLANGTIRISLSKNNNYSEIDAILNALSKAIDL